jgi:hydroxymethylglutaryl-CoA reductase (NADPH)
LATGADRISAFLNKLLDQAPQGEILDRLRPSGEPMPPRVPGGALLTPEAVERRWEIVPEKAPMQSLLLDPTTLEQLPAYAHNIENLIGTVKVPVGLAGPLRVNGLFATGDYYVPLATTEAALVASFSRGAQLISEAGGCTALTLNEGVSRAPGFAFDRLEECGLFVQWVLQNLTQLKAAGESTTAHGKLQDLKVTIEGNHVYLHLDFTTGDAAGQNMVTIAAAAICTEILTHCPVKPQYSFVEANCSGDKKASALSFLSVRGKKVTAEVRLSGDLVRKRLHTTPLEMERYWRMAAIGGVLSGTLGINGHYANGLAALYLACGQDAACVSESAVGVTRFELTEGGGLYASVTLPNVIVGTVGGGTGLPSQRACLQILGLAGAGHANALAEVAAALCLAGELSIIGALSSNQFARAHQRLARGRVREARQN